MHTARLNLRSFRESDCEPLYQLISSPDISDTMISIPHPVSKAFAETFVSTGQPARFAICQPDDALVGSVEIRDIDEEHRQGELSFWIGRPFWNRGFAAEAGAAMIHYAFEELGLNRVYAYHMVINPASGRVLSKLGMRQEGWLRQRVLKARRFEDVALWAVLLEDIAAKQ